MQRNRVASDSELPYDHHYELPEVTKWRKLEDTSVYNDLLYKSETIQMPPDTDEPASEFIEELKPVLYAMKAFGLFPLQRTKPGESTFRRCKLSFLYSVVFYMAMNVYAYYVSRERMHFISYSEASFDDLMYSVVHFLYVIPHFYLIPCHWMEVCKVGNYLSHWSDFQKQYHIVTQKQLHLGQTRRAYRCLILSPLLALLFVISEFFMSFANEKTWELGFYWYILVLIFLHVSWWWLVCSSLRSAIKAISVNFFKDTFIQESSAMLVAQYRVMWMMLNRLVHESGLFMCYTYGLYWVLSFSVVTLSLYGSLSNVHDGIYLKHVGLAMSVFIIGILMYICADSAHHTAVEIGPEFSEKLSHLCVSDKQVRRELKIFTQVMATNSSTINLGGYVVIDRGFLLRYMGTIVTYLVVLLQFRLGLLSISNTNVTVVPSGEEALTSL